MAYVLSKKKVNPDLDAIKRILALILCSLHIQKTPWIYEVSRNIKSKKCRKFCLYRENPRVPRLAIKELVVRIFFFRLVIASGYSGLII